MGLSRTLLDAKKADTKGKIQLIIKERAAGSRYQRERKH